MRKLLEIASKTSGGRRIHIEKINWPMPSEHKATPAGYKPGLDLAITHGLLWLHESGPCVKFT
jgi:hypothetical protein